MKSDRFIIISSSGISISISISISIFVIIIIIIVMIICTVVGLQEFYRHTLCDLWKATTRDGAKGLGTYLSFILS